MTIPISPNQELLTEINIDDIKIENPTEYQHVELCKHFKETIEKKNYKIERLSKTLAVLYGLVTLLSTELCPVILHQTHNHIEQEMEWLLDLDH
tara:strand:+ start:1201 stop:1482 length:282 start_codon:yes stop_codon:yes gene_type:complete